jgi:hypothetical protein
LRSFFATAIAVSLLSLGPGSAFAQTTCGDLSGLVVDASHALIPGAQVSLDGKATRVSDAGGHFSFPCVREGKHTLTATAEGFSSYTIHMTSPYKGDLRMQLVAGTEVGVTVYADEAGMEPAAPGGTNGLALSGRQLQSLADDPDDLLRQIQQLGAMAGGSPSKTTVSVDGFQGDSQLPPKDSIAFINVNPDLFSAEYREPPFGGGRVNIYTKPGAKTYHGAFFATNSSSWMNAADPFATSTGKLGKQRYGFDLSGPIRKEGSNFSLSLEHRSIDSLAVVNAVTLDAAGAPQSTIYNVPTPQALWEASARVDWQLGPKNIFFTSYSTNAKSTTNNGVGGSTLLEAGYGDSFIDQTVRVSNVTTFSPKLMHEARASFEWYDETDTPNSTAPGLQVSGYFTGGGATIGNTVNHRQTLEYDDDFLVTAGRHTMKTGIQFYWKRRDSNLYTNFNGNYVFADIQHYAASTPEEFNNVSGNPNVPFQQYLLNAFFQDDVKLKPNLTLSFGLRYFMETDPDLYRNFAPRVGFVWSPDKKSQWKLQGHFGVFNDQHGGNEIEEMHRLDGVERVSSLVYNPTYGSPLAGATVIHQMRRFAPDFTIGTFVIGEVGVSKDLPWGFNINLEEVQARFLSYGRTVDINQPRDGNPYGTRPFGANLDILQATSNGTGQGHGEIFVVSNFKHKRVQGVVGMVHLNLRDNTNDSLLFQPQSAYSDAGEQVHRSDQGTWQIFGNGSVNLPYKVAVSIDGYAQGHQPFNLLTGTDNNGDGNFNDRPQFAAPGALANGTTVFATPFGLMTNAGPIANGIPLRPIQRNLGTLPWNIHLDANVQRTFPLTHDTKAAHAQSLTVNVRSANFLNYTNVTSEGSVLGSPQFLIPVAADNGRRVEAGLRYSF